MDKNYPMDARYVDIHSHLNLSQFDHDRDRVVECMRAQNVGTITVGTCRKTSERAIAIAEAYDCCYATVGVHPCDVIADGGEGVCDSNGEGWDSDYFKALSRHDRVVAIGECGLDYYHHGDNVSVREREREIFIEQIMLANEVKKPLMLHIRSGRSGRNAYADTIDILKNYAHVKGNVHFFSGTEEDACAFFDLGYTISFAGVITFVRDYDDIIRLAPLDMIHAETDAPFVAPVPHRGKRNEPAFVTEVYKMIASVKGIDEETVRIHLRENSLRVFGM